MLESTDGDGSAVLGVAQVNIGQERWDEALENSAAALLRFNQTGDMLGQADAQLTHGLAHSSKDELDEALTDFEQALNLYQRQNRPLGIADARFALGALFMTQGKLEQARDEQTKAISQVERVMNTLRTPQQWSTFLRQYAKQYAESALCDLRRNQDEQARTLLQNFVRIAGTSDLVRNLKTYEDTIPTASEELSEEELRTNRELVRRLERLRKSL